LTSDLLFVNGTLMRGLALHANLDGAEFVEEARTAPIYRIHSIGDVHPGMYLVPDRVWRRVEAGEPPGLYRGPVSLADGRVVPGILYPRELAEEHRDISDHGGWRAYWASRTATEAGEG
jgi:AGZA family xanthine/uracil permease-like MFS transporter